MQGVHDDDPQDVRECDEEYAKCIPYIRANNSGEFFSLRRDIHGEGLLFDAILRISIFDSVLSD